STVPCFVTVLPTALKMLSATGSIMYFINSLTDTTGRTSPSSAADCGASDRCAGAGGRGDEEHAAIVTLTITSPARARRARGMRHLITAAPIEWAIETRSSPRDVQSAAARRSHWRFSGKKSSVRRVAAGPDRFRLQTSDFRLLTSYFFGARSWQS